MDAHGTNLAEVFAATAIEKWYEMAVTPVITNEDYEGEIKNKSSRLNIMTFSETQGLQTYSGSTLTLGTTQESEATLNTDQQKAYYFSVQSINTFKGYVEDPQSTLMVEKAGQLQEAIDTYVLGIAHSDTASGNRVGTSYTTGTVGVTATTGAVAGTGTTFTADMVGLGFKATGHSVWYRIKTFTNTTTIVIEDDSDDNTSAYTGGTIATGTAYEIEAVTPTQATSATAYGLLLDLKQKLDESKTPKENRWCVVNAAFVNALLQASVIVRDTGEGEERTNNGKVTKIAGMTLYENEELAGTNTSGAGNGVWAVAGHKKAIVFALAFTETGIEDLVGDFGKAYKGLNVYGAKVTDERRKALAALRFYT